MRTRAACRGRAEVRAAAQRVRAREGVGAVRVHLCACWRSPRAAWGLAAACAREAGARRALQKQNFEGKYFDRSPPRAARACARACAAVSPCGSHGGHCRPCARAPRFGHAPALGNGPAGRGTRLTTRTPFGWLGARSSATRARQGAADGPQGGGERERESRPAWHPRGRTTAREWWCATTAPALSSAASPATTCRGAAGARASALASGARSVSLHGTSRRLTPAEATRPAWHGQDHKQRPTTVQRKPMPARTPVEPCRCLGVG